MTPPITLTPIELTLYLAVYARTNNMAHAAEAVCELGRIPFPQYTGPWPVGDEVIVEHDAAMAERGVVVIDLWRAVCIANTRQAESMGA